VHWDGYVQKALRLPGSSSVVVDLTGLIAQNGQYVVQFYMKLTSNAGSDFNLLVQNGEKQIISMPITANNEWFKVKKWAALTTSDTSIEINVEGLDGHIFIDHIIIKLASDFGACGKQFVTFEFPATTTTTTTTTTKFTTADEPKTSTVVDYFDYED
jgi:hypothetical protein